MKFHLLRMHGKNFKANDLRSYAVLVGVAAKERPQKFRPELDSNPDLCNAGVVFHQSNHQADGSILRSAGAL